MMFIISRIFAVVLFMVMFAPTANASVPYPLFDITDFAADNGMLGTSAGLSIDATAFSFLNSSTDAVDIPDVEFVLQAMPGSSSSSFQYDYGDGHLIVGDSLSTLISADFDSLSLLSFDGLSGTFSADLYNMTGSTAVHSTGRIEGTFFNSSASIFGGDDFSADLIAKVGPSSPVPLPGALVLLIIGLLCMSGQVRRSK